MNNCLKWTSIISFACAIPSLIIVDWYLKGFGVLAMFCFISLGLIMDQVRKMYNQSSEVTSIARYRRNKRINIISLILYVQSPMALLYGNQIVNYFGTTMMIFMICLGITLNQYAKRKYIYQIKEDEVNATRYH